jgi:peptide deformylase
MAKEIITDLSILSERSEEIKDIRKEGKEVQEITLALKEAIREYDLPALAAPQIGYKKRIFVINFNNDLRTFVDPVIDYREVKGMGLSIEQCPSIPNKKYLMIRNSQIPVMYMTPIGQPKGYTLNGMAAYTYQRMMNLLDGVLLSDTGLEIDDDFINASDEERAPIISSYLDALDIKQKSLDKEIDESKELKEIKEAGEFIQSVASGETKATIQEEKLPEVKKPRGRKKKEDAI